MADWNRDTVFAPATLPGTGAISILRVSGQDCFQIVDSIVQLKRGTISGASGYSLHFGMVYKPDSSLLDEVLVSVFRAPNSYTGEDSVELSCHASKYILSELMALLSAAGARMAEPGEFTRRSFLNGKMDLAQAEAVADVISSTTSASHRVAMNQMRGGYSQELAEIRSELLEMASLLELELDFSEEDVEFVDRSRLEDLLSRASARVSQLAGSFYAGNAIKNGIPVAIVGPPNAGKSTLLNALLGDDRAIVSDIPGTTRDTIEECFQLDGVMYRFIDTAGIHETEQTIERIGIERTMKAISAADVVVLVLDSSSPAELLAEQLSFVLSRLDPAHQSVVIVVNKVDLMGEIGVNKIVTMINNYVLTLDFKHIVVESSLTELKGLDEIKKAISSVSPQLSDAVDSTLVTNFRHFEALTQTAASLSRVRLGLHHGAPTDLLAEDLRSAISSLSSITGHSITPDEILGNIFSKFCIGK